MINSPLVRVLPLVLLVSGAASPLLAQTAGRPAPPPAPPAAEAPTVAPAPPVPPPAADDDDDDDDGPGRQRGVVRVGQDYVLPAGERAREVVVVMGDATIDGQVDRDVVVVLGHLTLGSGAVVERSVTSVAGGVTVRDGAVVRRDLVVVAGRLDAPAGFKPGGEHVTITPGPIGNVQAAVPFLTRGLLIGRVIVPGLRWMWVVLGILFLFYAAINLLADAPVRASADALEERGLTAFGAGLLTVVLVGPVCVLLALSVVGLLVIPVVLLALFAAAVVGKVATHRWLGSRILRDRVLATPLRAFLAFAIGFAVLVVAYLIPVLGIVAWALTGVFGLGGAALAIMTAWRREHPAAPRPAVPPTYPPPVPPSAGTTGVVPDAGLSYADAVPPVPPIPPVTSASSAADAGQPFGAPSPGFAAPALAGMAVPAVDLTLFPRAGFGERLGALVLDVILVSFVVNSLGPFSRGRLTILALLAYHVAFWAWKQTTVGGIICHLRLVRVDGHPLSAADALVRGFSGIFSMLVVGLGFLWVLRDPERQSWHDKIAGTYVVRVPRTWRT